MSRARDHLNGGELSRADRRALDELAEGLEPTAEQRRALVRETLRQRPLTATLGELLAARKAEGDGGER